MQQHDWSIANPKGAMLHLSLSLCTGLAVVARIKFKTLMLAYRTATGSAPSYFHSLLRILSTSPPEVWDLRASLASSAIRERHKITLQNVFIHRSWLVEWPSHLHPEPWIPDNFQATPENSSLSVITWIRLKKKMWPCCVRYSRLEIWIFHFPLKMRNAQGSYVH